MPALEWSCHAPRGVSYHPALLAQCRTAEDALATRASSPRPYTHPFEHQRALNVARSHCALIPKIRRIYAIVNIPEHVGKPPGILATLHAAPTVAHMDLPGFRLHPLKGEMKGYRAVTVRANWRVTFRFADGHAEDVDYVDYH